MKLYDLLNRINQPIPDWLQREIDLVEDRPKI